MSEAFDTYWKQVPPGAFADDGIEALARVIAKRAYLAALEHAEAKCREYAEDADEEAASGADRCADIIRREREG